MGGKTMTKEIMTKCWNGHYTIIPVINDAVVGSGYYHCNECEAVIVERRVRRDQTKTTSVAEMFFVQ
jgi:hypothetical protein